MPRPIILIHGWSADSDDIASFRAYLKRNPNQQVYDIFVGDYLSMQDEVTLFDLGSAMIEAFKRENIPTRKHSVDVVVHSTGALVVREFLRQFCRNQNGKLNASKTPIKHLLMLAPANFGSPLASKGRSILGRIFKGWKWDGFLETGTEVLKALDLSSPYSWSLAEDDLFNPDFPIFRPENVMATVLVGTNKFPKLKGSLHEDGSDGTVRVATANLNAKKFSLEIKAPDSMRLKENTGTYGKIASAVLNRDHGSIKGPDGPQSEEWERLVKNALSITPRRYGDHVRDCAEVTSATFQSLQEEHGTDEDRFHEFMHLATRVRDQYGEPINDYFIEFYQEDGDDDDRVLERIHRDILKKAKVYQPAPNHRSFLFDITDLNAFLRENPETEVRMSIVAINPSKDITYCLLADNEDGGIPVFRKNLRKFTHPNCPVLLDIVLPRKQKDRVFTLKK